MTVEKITMDDIKNNHQKVLDFLDETFFTDSTVYMMPEDYIKSSVIDRLVQVALASEKIVELDKNPESLSRSMLRASLRQEDVDMILNASLRISGVTLAVETVADLKEKDADAANKMVEDQKKSMASIETIIGIVDDCLGTSRVTLVASEESALSMLSALSAAASTVTNTPPPEPPKDTLKIERPMILNTSFLDLKKIDNEAIFNVLSQLLATDSNSTLDFHVPLKCFTDEVVSFLTTDLPAFSEVAAAHAVQLSSKCGVFVAEANPFETLFNTL